MCIIDTVLNYYHYVCTLRGSVGTTKATINADKYDMMIHRNWSDYCYGVSLRVIASSMHFQPH